MSGLKMNNRLINSRKSGKEKYVDLSEMPRTRRSKRKKKKNFNCKTNC